jgi:hypothetical protein
MTSSSFRVPAGVATDTRSGAVRGDTGLLRLALRLDAVATGVFGVAVLAGCALVDSTLGLSTAFLAGTGAFVVLYALAVWRVAAAQAPNRTGVRVVIALNLLWTAASLVTAFAGWLDPTGMGTALIVLQAVVVLGFVDLQVFAVRKAHKSVR